MNPTGFLAYWGALSVAIGFSHLQLKLREKEGDVWWASTGRDVLNLSSLAILTGGFSGLQVPLPHAAVASTCVLLCVNFIQSRGFRQKGTHMRPVWSFVVGSFPLLGLPTMERGIGWPMRTLF
jgi:hypothetical protein